MGLDVPQNCRLYTGKGEIESFLVEKGSRETHQVWVSLARQTIDDHAAGISEPQHLGHLVVGLTGRIVTGLSEKVKFAVVGYVVDAGVAAGNQEGHEGEGRRVRLQKDGVDVRLQMIHADPWNPMPEGKSLGKGKSDQKGSDQSWTLGDGHAVDFAGVDFCCGDGRFDDGNDGLHVLSGSQFGYDTTIEMMNGHLGGDFGGEDSTAVFHYGRRRFVTGGFYAQYDQGQRLFLGGDPTGAPVFDSSVFANRRFFLAFGNPFKQPNKRSEEFLDHVISI